MDGINVYRNYLIAEKRYSTHTSDAYLSDIKQFTDYLAEAYSIKDIKLVHHLHVRSWFAKMVSKGTQARSIRRKISSLNTFYKFLKKRDLCLTNPMTKVVCPKIKKRLPVTVNEVDLEGQLNYSPKEDDSYKKILSESVIQSLYGLGIRRSELIQLRLTDLNCKSRQLKVMGKGGKERIIPFGDELRKIFERYFLVRQELKILDENYLFLLPNGRKLYPKMVYLIVNNWLKTRTSLSKRSPHILRHSFATHLADHGADINAIKELLGHANLSATQIYTHNSIEQLRKSYRQAHPHAAKQDS